MKCELSYTSLMFTREHAKRQLKKLGWSYRSAAPLLGVTYQHLSEVLNGNRPAARLLTAIRELPLRDEMEGEHERGE